MTVQSFDRKYSLMKNSWEVYADPTDAMGQFVDRGDSREQWLRKASQPTIQKDIVTIGQARSILQKNITKISKKDPEHYKRYRGLSGVSLLSSGYFGNKEKG